MQPVQPVVFDPMVFIALLEQARDKGMEEAAAIAEEHGASSAAEAIRARIGVPMRDWKIEPYELPPHFPVANPVAEAD